MRTLGSRCLTGSMSVESLLTLLERVGLQTRPDYSRRLIVFCKSTQRALPSLTAALPFPS